MKLLQQLLSKSCILSASITLGLGILGSCSQTAQAEGSRDLYPSDTGYRANLEWRTDITGGLVFRRTLLHIYANAGEYILMGSSAVGVTGANGQKGDIFVYDPNLVSGSIGSETFPGTPSFKCSTLVGRGVISSRAMELAGAQNITGTGNLTGYKPCYYKAPFNGVYDVVVMGPQGFSAAGDGGPTAEVPLTSTTNFSSTQGTSVAAWDVTVRSGSTDALAQASTVDVKGRLFSYYLALFTAGNGRPVYSTFYPITLDGYIYKTEMRGTDPNGYLVYGNEVGFFNSDGQTPLYHDLMTGNGALASIQGGATLSRPQFPTFFNYPPDFTTLSYIKKFDRFGSSLGTGITNSPIPPGVSNANFTGTLTGNSSKVGNGGTFTFNTNVVGNYEIVIKGSGSTDYDPTNPKNRVLRGYINAPGTRTVTWDGKDNNGVFFPVGINYPYTIRIKAGEYHFPLLDAENNFYGGPTITLMNQPTSYPADLPGFTNTTGFYDDRAYKTFNGTIVDSTRTQANIDANAALCGTGATSPAFSNQVTGFLTTTNQRTFGASTGGNTNVACTGSFGDTKGMDQWTYFPSSTVTNFLNIVSPDLTITKTHSDPFPKGGTGIYTITVPNTGNGSTDGTTVTVSDTLPTGLTPTTATGTGWTCTVVGQTVTCTRTDVLATGASYPAITVNLTVSASAAAQVTNTATVSGGGDVTPGNNTVSDVTNISTIAPPDLSITKTHSGNFTQGQTGKTYTLTVSNATGAGATSGIVTMTDTLPTGLTPTAATGTGWTCSISGQTVTCTRSDILNPNASYPAITLTVDVASNASASLTNVATVSGGGDVTPANNSGNDPTTITTVTDLTITKSHSGNFGIGQQNAPYTITVSNATNAATSSGVITVVDTLPTGLTPTNPLTYTATGWTSCTANYTTNAVTCTHPGPLAGGASLNPITLNVNVDPNASATLLNTATVSGGNDANSANNTANDPTTIDPKPDLIVTKTHTGDFVVGPPAVGSYTITVQNIGNASTAGSITVTDTIASTTNFTYKSISGTNWTCTTNCTNGTTTKPTIFTYSGTLAAGATSTPLTVNINPLNSTNGATVDNTVVVAGGGEVNTSNNTAIDPTRVRQNTTTFPDLAPTKALTGSFTQGATNVGPYTITVTNIGNAATTNTATSVTDTLPTGLTLINPFTFNGGTASGGTNSNWTCTANYAANSVTCTRTATNSNNLAAGASWPNITFNVNVDQDAPASVTNTVVILGTSAGQTGSANDTSTLTSPVTQKPDLIVSKTHTGSFTQGDTNKGPYTITVKNIGNAATTGVVTVVDTLPSGLTPVTPTFSINGWSCTTSGQVITCTNTPNLATNATSTITFNVSVDANAPANVTNSVTVSGGGEIITTNNTGTDSATIAALVLPDLVVSKTAPSAYKVAGVSTFTQGSTGTYNITVTNNGSLATSAGQTVTVTDTLPTGLTLVASSGFTINGWSCTPNSPSAGQLRCTRSDVLAVGASYPLITFDVNVAANASTPLTNNVIVAYASTELNTGNNSGSDNTTIVTPPRPDLTVTKSHTGNFKKGGTGTYNLTVTNTSSGTGPTNGTTVTVTDTLPTGLSPVTPTFSINGWSCTTSGQVITCTRTDAVAVNSSYPLITFDVNVAQTATVGSTLTNTASVVGGGDTTAANTTDNVTVGSVPDLTITKTGPSSFVQSGTGTYTLTVNNAGSAATDGTLITVTDPIPGDLTVTSVTGTNWNCSVNSSTVTCTRTGLVLAAGASSADVITVNVQVSSNPGSSVSNTATIAGGGETDTTNNTATKVSTISLLPDLILNKTHTGSFAQGGTGTYLLTVSNTGSGSTTSSFSITDTLPTGLSFVTPISGSGTNWSCGSPSGQNITCNYSAVLAPSGTTYLGNPEPAPPLSLFVNIAANATLSLLNTANVSGGGETNTTNNGANDLTTITPTGPVPDLTINKTYSSAFTRNSVGTYTLKVRNIGDGPTTGSLVTVTDTLPTELTPTSANFTINGWTCTASGQIVTCTRSDVLGAGASYPDITLNVNVAANAPASVLNGAAVSGGGDSDSTNNNDSTLTFIDYPDLTILKTHSGSFGKGGTGTYTLKVTNVGKAATDNSTVTVTDTLPADLIAPITASGTGWTCNVVGNAITCTRLGGNLAIAASYPDITITAKVSNTAPTSITNTATITNGSGGENYYANNSSTDPTDITTLPDLIISKSHTGNFSLGGTGSYNLTVTNSGGSSTSGTITVTDTLPTGLTPTGASGTGWTCSISGQTVTCTSSASLAVNANANAITVGVSVASNAPANTTNTAIVSGGGEVNTNNNTANDPTIINYPDLTILKTHSGTFTQGVNSSGVATDPTYSITVTNSGGAAIPAGDTITVVDTLPTGLTLYNSSAFTVNNWSCTPNSPSTGEITCTRSGTNSALAVGASYPTIDFKVNIASNAPPSVDNTAVVSKSGIESNTNNNTAIDSTAITLLPPGSPSLLLIKRITAINGVAITGFVSDGRTAGSPAIPVENDNWPSPTSTYLRGQTAINNIKPGDDVEYTIYFLSNGAKDVTNVTICDLVPANTTFIPNSFGASKGIGLGYDTTALANPTTPNISLTNVDSDDRGEFYPAGMQPPTSCKKPDSANSTNYIQMTSGDNTNGLVIVNIAKNPTSTFPAIPVSTIPKATGAGTPFGSYGYIRFKATVK